MSILKVVLTIALFAVGLRANPVCSAFYNSQSRYKIGINRELNFARLIDTQYDVLIIGGGSAGLGSALDATTRGLNTILVEADDFASETSSKSTKLLHGGVRYLEQLWNKLLTQQKWDKTLFNLIRDALKERKTVIENAPNLAKPLPLLTPIYSWPQIPYYWAGLKVYDLFAGKKGKLPGSYLLSAKKIKELYPQVNSKNLKGGVVYFDGQFNDARLALSLAQTSASHGATLLNHTKVIDFIKEGDRIVGVKALDTLTGDVHSIRAKIVLNATGPFADRIRKLDDPEAKEMISGASGTHLVLDKHVSLPDTGILIPKTSDGRVLFVLPWEGKTLIGTTDSKSDVVEKPKTTEEDINYLIKEVSQYLSEPISRSDVRSFWTGIRPLVSDPSASDTAQLARDHVINLNPTSGLITLTGGKWTTYRVMGEHAIDEVVRQLGQNPKKIKSITDSLKLDGSSGWQADGSIGLAKKYNLPDDVADYLNHIYGSHAALLLDSYPKRHSKISEKLPFIWAEVFYSIHYESARSITDVLGRRVRMATLDKNETQLALANVGKILAKELGWSQAKLSQEIEKAEIEFQLPK